MRVALFLAGLAVLPAPAVAQDEAGGTSSDMAEPVDEVVDRVPRRCIAPQAVVPPFNNTPEAMEQSRVAATVVAGDRVCKTSPLTPELSEIQHGPEEAVVPEAASHDTAEPA